MTEHTLYDANVICGKDTKFDGPLILGKARYLYNSAARPSPSGERILLADDVLIPKHL